MTHGSPKKILDECPQGRISEFTSYDEKSETKNALLWAYSSGNGMQFVEWETKENSISSMKGVSICADPC